MKRKILRKTKNYYSSCYFSLVHAREPSVFLQKVIRWTEWMNYVLTLWVCTVLYLPAIELKTPSTNYIYGNIMSWLYATIWYRVICNYNYSKKFQNKKLTKTSQLSASDNLGQNYLNYIISPEKTSSPLPPSTKLSSEASRDHNFVNGGVRGSIYTAYS